jgi:uridine kinase
MSAFVIGVTGGSGSGKSTLIRLLREGPLGGQIAVIGHDAYYLNRADMPTPVREANNWDHPDALDNALFLRHINALASGEPIEQPVYDFSAHARSAQVLHVEARPVLVLDGILLLAVAEVRRRLDLAVFVDTPADLRLVRRVMRDVAERGRSVESVMEQYLATVRPMHELFVEPGRQHADLIVPWGIHNQRAVEVLAARIAAHLSAGGKRT